MRKMKYIKELSSYKTKCQRLLGFKKLQKAGLKIPSPLLILSHQAFIFYKKEGFLKPLKKEIEAAFFLIKKKSPKRAVYCGRAYFVPGIENPPGPRFALGSSKDLLRAVKEMFDFAIKNKYDKREAEIGVIFHPWINPKTPFGGGCAALSTNKEKTIVVEAIYGLDEGVQSFPHDIYLVDWRKNKILKKEVPLKKECLEVDKNFEVRTVKVEKKYWLAQVLTNELIKKVAKGLRQFIRIYGPHRIEFAFEKEGLFWRECLPFLVKKEKKAYFKGKVLQIKKREDLEKVNHRSKIIFIDPEVIKKRKMNLLTILAAKAREPKIILFPGSATTAHAATIFREMGHQVIYVGERVFVDGEEINSQTLKDW